jgi:hypothetical protein
MSRRVLLGVIVLTPCLAVSVLVAQAPSLESVLVRAGEYVAAYNQAHPLLVAEESYQQIFRPYGSTDHDLLASDAPLGEMGTPKVRQMRCELALMAVRQAHGWLVFRDVFEVDGKALRAEKNRLERAFTDSFETAPGVARTFTDAALKYNLGRTLRDVNVPTFPLMFLMPQYQQGFTFTKKGEKRVDGATVWVIEYVETQRPALSTTADGSPKPARGELSVEPASGRVVKTHLVFDTLDAYPDMKLHPERYRDFPRVIIDVTYKRDAALNAWLPLEVEENYTRRDEVVTCKITYSNFRRVKLAPIGEEE